MFNGRTVLATEFFLARPIFQDGHNRLPSGILAPFTYPER